MQGGGEAGDLPLGVHISSMRLLFPGQAEGVKDRDFPLTATGVRIFHPETQVINQEHTGQEFRFSRKTEVY